MAIFKVYIALISGLLGGMFLYNKSIYCFVPSILLGMVAGWMAADDRSKAQK